MEELDLARSFSVPQVHKSYSMDHRGKEYAMVMVYTKGTHYR
jgi:hypothetical protein